MKETDVDERHSGIDKDSLESLKIKVAQPDMEDIEQDEDDEEMEPAPVPKKPMIKKKVTVAAKK
jgi:hypothetical protein